jgi:pyrroline-5-carboxylate reductase
MRAAGSPLAMLLLGCGNMGQALVHGWRQAGLDLSRLLLVDPQAQPLADAQDLTVLAKPPEPAQAQDVVLLAVKPQVLPDVLPALQPFVAPHTLVLSIAAGVSVKSISAGLGGHQTIIRAMPNTPAAIQRGITAAVASAGVTEPQIAVADQLLQAIGKVRWVAQEAQMDAVTAVSGSGPAYVFYLLECLSSAAESAGLPADLARDPAVLRQQVTSPHGTTEAGLDVLMSGQGLAPLIRHTVEAAARRSRELGKEAGRNGAREGEARS